jgi:hypothetical protein
MTEQLVVANKTTRRQVNEIRYHPAFESRYIRLTELRDGFDFMVSGKRFYPRFLPKNTRPVKESLSFILNA